MSESTVCWIIFSPPHSSSTLLHSALVPGGLPCWWHWRACGATGFWLALVGGGKSEWQSWGHLSCGLPLLGVLTMCWWGPQQKVTSLVNTACALWLSPFTSHSLFTPSSFIFLINLFLILGVHCEVCGILVPWPGMEPMAPTVEAWSSPLDHQEIPTPPHSLKPRGSSNS